METLELQLFDIAPVQNGFRIEYSLIDEGEAHVNQFIRTNTLKQFIKDGNLNYIDQYDQYLDIDTYLSDNLRSVVMAYLEENLAC